jgi:hypothetical protein
VISNTWLELTEGDLECCENVSNGKNPDPEIWIPALLSAPARLSKQHNRAAGAKLIDVKTHRCDVKLTAGGTKRPAGWRARRVWKLVNEKPSLRRKAAGAKARGGVSQQRTAEVVVQLAGQGCSVRRSKMGLGRAQH